MVTYFVFYLFFLYILVLTCDFTAVRVPRSHLLQKYSKVSRSGVVVEPPLAQLTYGALITGRVSMIVGALLFSSPTFCYFFLFSYSHVFISDSSNTAKKALTIALRYAAIRRQFGATPTAPQETKLLDYVIHQHRLIPLLAQAFAAHFCGVEVRAMADSLTDRLAALSSRSKNEELSGVLGALKELHGTSAGLKAFCTWATLDTIDKCRQSLGGHGYSAYTGLASMYNDFAVQCTWEGDNTILALQSGRYLVGCYREALRGKKQSGGVAYLNDFISDSSSKAGVAVTKRCKARSVSEIADLDMVADAFWLVSANAVRKAADEFETYVKAGSSEDQAYEECCELNIFDFPFPILFFLKKNC